MAWSVKVLADPVLGPAGPYLIFPFSILISATLGGLGPGLVATTSAVAIVAASLLKGDPSHLGQLADVRLVAFAAQGVGITLLATFFELARERAVASSREAMLAAEAQRAGQEQLVTVLTNVSDAFLLLGRDLKVLYMNPQAQAHFRVTDDVVVGHHLWDIFPAIAGSEFDRAYRRALEQRQPVDVVVRSMVWPDRWVELRVFPTVDGLSVYFRDVTDRRRTEDQLRLITDALPAFVSYIDANECYRFTNKAAAHWWGRPPESLVGKRLQDVMSPDLYASLKPQFQTVLAGKEVRFERRIEDPTGRPRYLSMTFVPHVDASGRVEGFIALTIDISDRKGAEDALRRSEQEYRAIFDVAGSGKAQADALTMRVIRANRKLSTITGYSVDQLMTMLITDLTHPDDRAAEEAAFDAIRRGETSEWSTEKRYVRADGSPIWVHVTGTVIRDDAGRPVRTISVVNDITQRKNAEDALRRLNETLEQRVAERTAVAEQRLWQVRQLAMDLTQAEQRERRRLATVLHDHLQQLLVAAKLRIASMTPRLSDPTQHAWAQKVDDLLGESIKASRSLTVELAPPISLADEGGMSAVFQWVRRQMLEAHGLAIELSIGPDVDPVPDDITALLLQAARELLFNTVKHSGVKSATVSLTRPQERFVRLTIADAGQGFDPESCDPGVPRTEGGFGLKHIGERMKLLGGKIEIDSAPGAGATITLTVPTYFGEFATQFPPAPVTATPAMDVGVDDLPYETSMANESNAEPMESDAASRDDRIRVLLADDHAILREGLAGLLRSMRDIEVVGQASDGYEAVELARKLRPEVVVMDVTMPRLSGVEATSRIREQLPATRIIGLSMHAHEDMAIAMQRAGARAYFTKGGPSEPLIAAIRDRSGAHVPKPDEEPANVGAM